MKEIISKINRRKSKTIKKRKVCKIISKMREIKSKIIKMKEIISDIISIISKRISKMREI